MQYIHTGSGEVYMCEWDSFQMSTLSLQDHTASCHNTANWTCEFHGSLHMNQTHTAHIVYSYLIKLLQYLVICCIYLECIRKIPLYITYHYPYWCSCSHCVLRSKRVHLEETMLCSSCFGITVYFFLHIENGFNCCFDLCLIVPMCCYWSCLQLATGWLSEYWMR